MARVVDENEWASMSRDQQKDVLDLIQECTEVIPMYPFAAHEDVYIFDFLVEHNHSFIKLNSSTALDLVDVLREIDIAGSETGIPTIAAAPSRGIRLGRTGTLSRSMWDRLWGEPRNRIKVQIIGTLDCLYLPMHHGESPETELIEVLNGKPMDPVYHAHACVYVVTRLVWCEGTCRVMRSKTWDTWCETSDDPKTILVGFTGIKFKVIGGKLAEGTPVRFN